MKRYWHYLKAVVRHKWFVFLACFRFRVPLWSAILHDWDKFLPDEFIPYARTFYTPEGVKQYDETPEFALAWMKHQHRNKHHWQRWLWVDMPSDNCAIPIHETNYLVWDRGIAQRIVVRNSGTTMWIESIPRFPSDALVPDPMPDRHRREMLADWFGAGRAYNADWTPLEPRKWYENMKNNMILHPETRAWVESELERQEHLYHLDMKRITLGL